MSTVLLTQSEPGFWIRLMAPQVHAAGHRAVLVTTPLTDRQRQEAAELVDEIVEMDDVNDAEALAATARELAADARIITCTDAAMVATTRAAELLGVARLPAGVYAGVRNKFAARRTLAAAGLPGPRFALIERAEDAPAVADQVGLPAVIKPVNGSGSNLVRVVRSADELAAAYRLLAQRLPGSMAGLYERPVDGADPTRVFLVESRLVGPEYCLDVVIRDGAVEPLKLVGKPFMDETFLEYVFVCPPFDLPTGREALIRERVVASVRALGLDNTVAHVELIDDATAGPAIVEVNVGRPGGGLVSALNELTSGINLFAECLAATLGDPAPPRTPPKITIPLAYAIVFGTGAGRLVKIHGLDDVAALPEVLEVVPTAEPGQILSDDHEVLAVNMLVAGFFDVEELAGVYEEAAKLIRLETEPVGDPAPVTVVADQWFVTRVRRPQAPVQLFCLPYAGAGAGAYAAWPPSLGIDVEVSALMLPGRERRWAEPPQVDPVCTAAAVSARADRPYALFGHSMGARLAFEVTRELRRTGEALPVHLFVSGCRPPDEPRDRDDPFDGWSELDDDELLGRLAAGGGVPPEILAEPELLELLLPVLRADLAWIDGYQYHDEPPLPVPVTGFAGDADQAAPPGRMGGWRRHTDAGFTLRVLAGGHFFLTDRLAELSGLIRADLRAAAQQATSTAEEAAHGR